MNKKGLRVHTYAFSPVPEKEQLVSLKFSPKLIHTLSEIIQSHEKLLNVVLYKKKRMFIMSSLIKKINTKSLKEI
jgi:hypothetical protein